jgi:transposase InsO family protein
MTQDLAAKRARYRLKIRERMVILEQALLHGLKPTAHRFRLDRKTIREWRDRFRAHGPDGLIPQYPDRKRSRVGPEVVPLVEHARRELRYGASRTRTWLLRVHRIRTTTNTIQRIFRNIGIPRLQRVRKHQPRQLKLFERDKPGDCVQVDVKFVRIGKIKAFQYTAIDDHSRFRVLRLYRRLGQTSSLDFLGELRRGFPFPIRKVQSDNGSEFSLAFSLAVQEAGIRHRYIRPRRPQQNGKVERSHRIDHEEFWGHRSFDTFETAASALGNWEHAYNFERFSLALGGRTPAEKLSAALPDAAIQLEAPSGGEALAWSQRRSMARASMTPPRVPV